LLVLQKANGKIYVNILAITLTKQNFSDKMLKTVKERVFFGNWTLVKA